MFYMEQIACCLGFRLDFQMKKKKNRLENREWTNFLTWEIYAITNVCEHLCWKVGTKNHWIHPLKATHYLLLWETTAKNDNRSALIFYCEFSWHNQWTNTFSTICGKIKYISWIVERSETNEKITKQNKTKK